MQSSQDNKRRRKAQSLSEILGKVLEPVVAKRTGMQLELLAAWEELVGAEYAGTTKPQKINWPRRAHEDDPFEPATLIVACEPATALFFFFFFAPILERTNQFFGFQAIKRIRILQKPVAEQTAEQPNLAVKLSAEEESRLKGALTEIDDPQLRETLLRLGHGVFSRKKRLK